MIERFKSWITGLLISIIVVIGLTYAASGLTDIITKGKTIEEIIIAGGLATLVSWIISIVLSELGFVHGFSHDDYTKAKHSKGQALWIITPNINKLPKFCQKASMDEYKKNTISYLTKVGLTYEKFQKGEIYKRPKPLEPLTKENKSLNKRLKQENKQVARYNKKVDRIIKKIQKCYYDVYTYNELVNGIDKPVTKKKKRPSVERYRTTKYSAKLVSSIITGIMFGYYGLMLRENPDWGMVIYLSIQFALFVAGGLVQYMRARMYVLNILRTALIEDTNALYRFDSDLKANPSFYKEEVFIPNNVIKDEQPITQPIKDNLLTEAIESEVSKGNGYNPFINQEKPKQTYHQ